LVAELDGLDGRMDWMDRMDWMFLVFLKQCMQRFSLGMLDGVGSWFQTG
jgi:hypothetical protein